MTVLGNPGISMFEAGRKIYSKETIFNTLNYRKLKRVLKSLWKDTADIASSWSTEGHDSNTLVYFPHRLLKQQTGDYMSACKNSYTGCNLHGSLLVRLQEIEAEVHALNAAFKWLNYFEKQSCEQRDKQLSDVKAIFIAVEVIFSEFKDNKNTDCECRTSMFIEQLFKLLTELSELLQRSLES